MSAGTGMRVPTRDVPMTSYSPRVLRRRSESADARPGPGHPVAVAVTTRAQVSSATQSPASRSSVTGTAASALRGWANGGA